MSREIQTEHGAGVKAGVKAGEVQGILSLDRRLRMVIAGVMATVPAKKMHKP